MTERITVNEHSSVRIQDGAKVIYVDPDPFYSQENQTRLKNAIADIKAGRNMSAHDLIED